MDFVLIQPCRMRENGVMLNWLQKKNSLSLAQIDKIYLTVCKNYSEKRNTTWRQHDFCLKMLVFHAENSFS